MPSIPTMIALATTAASTATSLIANQQASEASKQEQAARRRQVELESERKRREIVRRMASDRARLNVASAASGSQSGSGFQGAAGQIQGQFGYDLWSQSRSDANTAAIFNSRAEAADAQSLDAFAGALGKVGSMVFSNSEALSRLTKQLTTNPFEDPDQVNQFMEIV